MSQPYDDSTQKDWKERKGKIEGYYRDIGQLGMNDNEKINYQKTCRSCLFYGNSYCLL